MEATGLLTRRAPIVILAALGVMLLTVPAVADAAFAGKPGRIAYSAELPGEDQSGSCPPCPPPPLTDRGFDIFTVDPDGSDVRRLTQNGTEPDDEREPNWSPDGTLIAFAAVYPYRHGQFGPYPARPDSQIELMAPDGSGRRRVTGEAGGARVPLFFPDGDRIYFQWSVVDLLQSGVSSVTLDGADERAEDRNLYEHYGPHISTDGQRKVFTGSDGDIYFARLDGSKARNLTNSPGVFEFGPRFAPDMSAVAFGRQDPAHPFASRVFVLDLRTGVETPISPPGQVLGGIDWGAIPVNCGGRRATIVGTEGKDKLIGTKGRDVFAGLGGRDKIMGKRGRDVLCGGKGKDRLSGGKGKDRLIGGKGNDRCIGGKGRDRAKGCEREKKI